MAYSKHGVPESIVCGLWRAEETFANVLCSPQTGKHLMNGRKPSQTPPEGVKAALLSTSVSIEGRGGDKSQQAWEAWAKCPGSGVP